MDPMTKTICLDFGNTRLKLAVFHGRELKELIVLKDDPVSELKLVIDRHKPEHSILSSVINHPEEIDRLLQQHTRFHRLSNLSKLPFTIPVGKPETMGADRLAI